MLALSLSKSTITASDIIPPLSISLTNMGVWEEIRLKYSRKRERGGVGGDWKGRERGRERGERQRERGRERERERGRGRRRVRPSSMESAMIPTTKGMGAQQKVNKFLGSTGINTCCHCERVRRSVCVCARECVHICVCVCVWEEACAC